MIKEIVYTLNKKENINNSSIFKMIKGNITIISIIILLLLAVGNYNNIPRLLGYFIPLIFMFAILFLIRHSLSKESTYKINIDSDSNEYEIIVYRGERQYKKLYKWGNAWKIENNSNEIVIYLSKVASLAIFKIPKRIFESEQELNETWELIQECYNKNREDIR